MFRPEIHALLRFDSQYDSLCQADQQGLEEEDKGRALLCAACRHLVTRSNEKIDVHGKHAHVFFNPAGIVFELGCFREAPGCTFLGRPTLEFTWFDGYAWRVCLCSRCRTHLGWHYGNVHGPGQFYGLILSQLIAGQG